MDAAALNSRASVRNTKIALAVVIALATPSPAAAAARALAVELASALRAASSESVASGRYVDLMGVLVRQPVTVLARLGSDTHDDWLTRRLAEIALDARRQSLRHRGLARYMQSEADAAAAEVRPILSATAANMPPRVERGHLAPEYRLAWEDLIMRTAWWPAKEVAAGVLRMMGPGPSARVLGLELRRAIASFDRDRDTGWRERAIMAMVLALASEPNDVALGELAAAYAAARDVSLQEFIVLYLRRAVAWQPVLQRALNASPTGGDAAFLARALIRPSATP